jgi:hypothetical protein
VRITRDIIATKLRSFFIPQGECGQKAFEIAGILLNQEINPFPDTRYDSMTDALAEVANAVTHEKIAIMWLDTGAIDSSNPSYRAIHCYFVFQDNPLQSFAIWDTPGAVFYDEACTRAKIIESIALFKKDGGIALHVVPPRCI